MLCCREEGRTVAEERKLMVSLEEMPTNRGSQGGRSGRSIQEHGRVDNPFRDSRGAQPLVVSFFLGSISTIR